jgi:cell division protein FtsN
MTVGATMGHRASATRIQARLAFTGIDDTITVGRVLYDSSLPIVPKDDL